MTDETILARLQRDLAVAIKSQDAARLSTLRMLKAALIEAKTRKAKAEGLTAAEEIEVVQRYARKRREGADEMRRHGRDDAAAREEAEIEVCADYLPQALAEGELRARVAAAVAATGAAGPRDAGRVIGVVMAEARGRADGATVSRLVREALAGG